MNKYLKIFIGVLVISIFLTKDKLGQYLGIEQEELEQVAVPDDTTVEVNPQAEAGNLEDGFVNDTIFDWDDDLMDWLVATDEGEDGVQFNGYNLSDLSSSKPIEIGWEVLMNIQYKLKYFSQIDMEMYAPVFPKEVEALHEKEVIIEGFVIPFEAEEEILSLSHFPYASCFFCGKASPASVLSMYMKKGGKNYKIDDFKKFKGVLYLNRDDPNEFYYILKNAEEV